MIDHLIKEHGNSDTIERLQLTLARTITHISDLNKAEINRQKSKINYNKNQDKKKEQFRVLGAGLLCIVCKKKRVDTAQLDNESNKLVMEYCNKCISNSDVKSKLFPISFIAVNFTNNSIKVIDKKSVVEPTPMHICEYESLEIMGKGKHKVLKK